MLRKMCKCCAPKGSENYLERKLTGEVTEERRTNDIVFPRIIKIVTCKECGHKWQFSRCRY